MKTILIVDDEVQVAKLLRWAFVSAGYDVVIATNGQQALEACDESGCFDVLLCDVVMPGIDGHELTRRVAARCPRTRIIHMSGFDPGCAECPYVSKCQLLDKPLKVKEVVSAVNTSLQTPPPQFK